ncbi:MAG: peptide ABC transporter substrate-binding protein [Eubacteriales bacterium]
MKKVLAALFSATLVLSLVGCGSSGDQSADGVTVTFAKENDVISMNSMYATDGTSFEGIHATVDGLMDQDADGNIVYSLASSYEISDDQLVYTFTIRDDANWDNGVAVTANDFVYAWSTAATSPEAEYAYLYTTDGAAIAGADEIVYEGADVSGLGVKAIDDKTLEVTLSQPTPYFLSLMTFPVFYPVNEEFATEQGESYGLMPENLLACGAYKLVSWEKGTKMTFDKNETYYDADAVQIDSLVFTVTPEVATSVTAFEGGSVDFTKLSSDLIDKYADTDEFDTVLEGYLWYLQPNLNDEDLSNLNLRLAIAYALDKEDLVENVLKDGSVVGDGFVPTLLSTGPDGVDFRETAGEYLVPDTTLAQEYFALALEELGTDTITISLMYENADPAKSAAEYLQANLQQNLPGLVVELDMQIKENRIELQKSGDFEIVLTRWGPDYADPTTYLNLMLTGNSYNYGDYSNLDYDNKMEEAAAAETSEERWAYLMEAEAILMEDVPVISVFQVGGASLIADGVEGLQTHAVGVPYIYKYVTKTVE